MELTRSIHEPFYQGHVSCGDGGDNALHGVSPLSAKTTELPLLATASDVREVVRVLKDKPSGITMIEALSAEPRRIFEPRKIAAYEFWGIVERENEIIRLSDLGRRFGETLRPECEVHRSVLRSIPAYFDAIELISAHGLHVVTRSQLLSYWKIGHPELAMHECDEKDIEAVCVSFFSLCHAAELGTATIGKRGQPARLRTDLSRVAEFLGQPPPAFCGAGAVSGDMPRIQRIYVSVRENGEGLKELHSALTLANYEPVIGGERALDDGILPDDQLRTIQGCSAAVFVLSAADCPVGDKLDPERAAALNAARAIFRERVLVLWSEPDVQPPHALAQLNLHVFDPASFGWADGLRLVTLLKTMHQPAA